MHDRPEELSDEHWAKAIAHLTYIREEEAKNKGGLF
jgi:hypothetical protein